MNAELGALVRTDSNDSSSGNEDTEQYGTPYSEHPVNPGGPRESEAYPFRPLGFIQPIFKFEDNEIIFNSNPSFSRSNVNSITPITLGVNPIKIGYKNGNPFFVEFGVKYTFKATLDSNYSVCFAKTPFKETYIFRDSSYLLDYLCDRRHTFTGIYGFDAQNRFMLHPNNSFIEYTVFKKLKEQFFRKLKGNIARHVLSSYNFSSIYYIYIYIYRFVSLIGKTSWYGHDNMGSSPMQT